MKRIMNLGYTFVGNLCIALVKWLILIIIVRFTSVQEVGYYTFAIALTTPLLLFINMRLRLRYVVENNLTFASIQKIRNLTSILVLFIIFLLGIFVFKEILVYMILVSIIRVLDLQSELYYAIYHKYGNYKAIGQNQMIKAILIIASFTSTMFITHDVKIALISQVFIQSLWLILFEKNSLNLIKNKEKTTKHKHLWTVFIFGVPLGIVQLINSYNILIPRYFIEGMLSIELVGIFASISYLLTIVDLFMNAISQNIIISIKKFIEQKQYFILNKYITTKALIIFLIMFISIPVITYFLAQPIILLIYGSEYSRYYLVLVIISFAISFNFLSWIYDTTLMAFKAYKLQLLVSVFTLLISVITSYYFISSYGVYGASSAVVIIAFAQSLSKYLLIQVLMRREKSKNENSFYS